jgi:hypothetical protein
MRLYTFYLLLALFGEISPSVSGQVLASVAFAQESKPSVAVGSPESSFADVVRYVGSIPSIRSVTSVPRQVFVEEVPDLGARKIIPYLSSADESVPVDASWPDSHDQIFFDPLDKGKAQGGSGIRNPWEVRVNAKRPREETVITCGGIIGVEEDGYIALVNGRVLRQGATLGEFSIVKILPSEVVLERNGFYAIVPRGRRVTVITHSVE